MAATKGAMTSLPASQTIFLQSVEEPENNSINFRDSLKFFQEQLVINGASFPSPSTACRAANDTLRKNGSRFCKEQNSDTNGKKSKDGDIFEGEIQSVRSCKISIPTVDTILESVRVLRAIQKSQKERGSNWNLDITSKSDIDSDFNLTGDWIRVSDINQDANNEKECYPKTNGESVDTDTVDTFTSNQVTEINGNMHEVIVDSTNFVTTDSNTPTAKNSFWPSNTLSENHLNKENLTNFAIELLDTKSEFHIHSMNAENLKRGEPIKSSTEESTEQIKTMMKQNGLITLQENLDHGDSNINDNNISSSENYIHAKNYKTNMTNNGESFDTPNSLNIVCNDLLTYVNEKNSNIDNSDEIIEKRPDSEIRMLEIEMYTDIDIQKDDFLLNVTVWKEDCSANQDSNLTKLENNDSDSGIGTQRSVSSLSPNIPNQMQKDSWSDTCSSQYASAECSPYHSLNSVFDSSMGLNQPAFSKEGDIAESSAHISGSEWEDAPEKSQENITIPYVTEEHTSISSEQIESDKENENLVPDEININLHDALSTPKIGGVEQDTEDSNCRNFVPVETTTDLHVALSTAEIGNVEQDTEDSYCRNFVPVETHTDLLVALSTPKIGGVEQDTEDSNCRNFVPVETPTNLHVELSTAEIGNVEQDTEDSCCRNFTPVEAPTDLHVALSTAEIGNVEQDTEDSYSRNFTPVETLADLRVALSTPEIDGVEQDTEDTYCFVSNYTFESQTLNKINQQSKEVWPDSETSDTLEDLPKTVNGHKSDINCEKQTTNTNGAETIQTSQNHSIEESTVEDDSFDTDRLQKFTATSCDLISIVETLYSIKESPAFQMFPADDEKFEETLYILSEGAFCEHPEDNYLIKIEDSILYITKDSQVLQSLNMKYGEVSVGMKNILKVDNKMGRCVYIKCDFESMINLKTEIELHCLKHWQTDCLQLVNYPLKYHRNVVIIDLGSCSTRAGILMDQPTLPTVFFPTICATNKKTGTSVYGMEALQPEVRQHSNLSFPVRPSVKITKHTIDIDLLEGLFKKIFIDLQVDPSDYTVQVCLPRNLSINAQNALVKLLLENLKVKSVSLANQALLTLYAHDVSTAVVVNIGDRTEVLPVVDGFIVENGVTKLPDGGQRLIHHMKHGLAENRISLSNDIDSFVVQYIIENLAYVAEDYDNEIQIASQYPDLIKKMITLQPALPERVTCKSITLEEARFKICEGLFNPELWGLDSPGIHHLVNKAIQATGVDVRKRIAENIYVSGGVTMLPGFVERLSKEVSKLSKAKIVPNVIASNYRYHCTYIGACKFAKMEVFPQVCITLEEYSENSTSALKKCALCF